MPKKTHKNTSAVFRIKPLSSTRAKIKHVGNLFKNEQLGDEPVELDEPIHPQYDVMGKHAIPIANIGRFEMVGRLYRCNIVGSHIVISNRYPMMYLNIHYDRQMVSGSLLQIFYSIDMDMKEKKEISESKNNAKYVNLEFTGTWRIHIDCDDELIENYEKLLIEMLENDAKKEMVSADTELSDTLWIKNYIEKNRTFYDMLMKGQTMEFRSLTKTRDWFLNLCQSENFYKFLEIAMKCREKHRRNDAGIDDESIYCVPDHITKMCDVRAQLITDNELILDEEEIYQ